ncbi:MAG: AtuA-related protein [Phenylobacterium sp.]
MRVRLHEVAHARAGDKGDVSMISVIAYRAGDYPLLAEALTTEVVAGIFKGLGLNRVERFELPGLGALNFVLHGALRGGVTRSLALDAHGKTLSSSLLAFEIDLPSANAAARDGDSARW